jgi:hypothetical protein
LIILSVVPVVAVLLILLGVLVALYYRSKHAKEEGTNVALELEVRIFNLDNVIIYFRRAVSLRMYLLEQQSEVEILDRCIKALGKGQLMWL